MQKIRGYLATANNRIVFLYRKTSKITYLISLDYQKESESIKIGSRFYGKIYPSRCDLSPDGTYFLYFAMGKSQKKYDKKLYCWTGICTPPVITANMLFAHGDMWGGGGRFIDDKTIYISPGMSPDFDIKKRYQFNKYKITFEGKLEDGGWGSGKDWKLTETRTDTRYGDKYPIPYSWIKTNGKTTLIKYSNYNFHLKSKDLKPIGSYDLYRYEIMDNKSELKYSLNDEEKICLWADYDNLGRLVVARENIVLIYKTLKDIFQNNPARTFDFENLTSLPPDY